MCGPPLAQKVVQVSPVRNGEVSNSVAKVSQPRLFEMLMRIAPALPAAPGASRTASLGNCGWLVSRRQSPTSGPSKSSQMRWGSAWATADR